MTDTPQPPKRNPYDISTWGRECGRGIDYKNLGTTIAGRPSSKKISNTRKARGKASDSFNFNEETL